MIAADSNRQLAGINNLLDLGGQTRAYRVNFGQVFQLLAFAWMRARPVYGHIAEIINLVTKLGDSLSEAGNANRRGSQIDAGHALSEAQRHAEHAHGLSDSRKLRMFRSLLMCSWCFDHLRPV